MTRKYLSQGPVPSAPSRTTTPSNSSRSFLDQALYESHVRRMGEHSSPRLNLHAKLGTGASSSSGPAPPTYQAKPTLDSKDKSKVPPWATSAYAKLACGDPNWTAEKTPQIDVVPSIYKTSSLQQEPLQVQMMQRFLTRKPK